MLKTETIQNPEATNRQLPIAMLMTFPIHFFKLMTLIRKLQSGFRPIPARLSGSTPHLQSHEQR
jgi:hypothetical protein